jgi:hypothetical protein
MLWVGGGILVHGFARFGLEPVERAVHVVAEAAATSAQVAGGAAGWLAGALGFAVIGLVIGALLVPFVGSVLVPAYARLRRAGG